MSTLPGRCGDCGGSYAHHQNDRACWCHKCMSGPDEERCKHFAEPKPKPPKPPAPEVGRNVVKVGLVTKETSVEAAEKAKPKSGTLRRQVYDYIAQCGAKGATDDEIEIALGRSHQSVSGARNTLSGDDLIRDSGLRRKTRYANKATAWVVTDLDDQSQAALGQDAPLIDLGPVPGLKIEDGVATIEDGPVTAVIPADSSKAVSLTVSGLTFRFMPKDRATLWDTISSEFVDSSDVNAVMAELAGEVQKFSASLKGVSR